MKLKTILSLIFLLISTQSFANGFRQISIGSGQLPESVTPSTPTNFVPGNPVTVNGMLTVPNGQIIDSLRLTVNVAGTDYVTTNSVSFGSGNNSFTISSGAIPAGNANITVSALNGTTVLYSESYSGSASIPDQSGVLLTDPDITTGSLDLAASDLVGVLENDGSVAIDSDILANLSALNAEIDEDDHGCSLAGGVNATGAQGRSYLICIMEAHYADVAAAALASFTAPTTTQLETCNTDELCGPAPSICSEAIWNCTVTSSTLPSSGTLSPSLNGPSTAPASFDGIDTTQQLGSATYEVALTLSTYTNPIPATSFSYSNLAYPAGIYSAPSESTAGLSAVDVAPLAQLSIETDSGFNYVNPQNSLTYTAELSDGSALPSWLSIDSSTGVLSGNPPYIVFDAGATSATINITGTDAQGASATVAQTLNVASSVPTNALANYATSAAQFNNETIKLAIHTDPVSWATPSQSVAQITGSKLGWFYTGSGQPGTRLTKAQGLSVLGVAAEGANAAGLRDSDGYLVTISDSSGTGAQGYLVVAIGHRGDGQGDYGHMMMQLYPLSNAANVASGDSLHLPLKAYGTIPDTASDATGSVVVTGTAEEYQTLTLDASSIADPDGLNPFTYQWFADGTAISGATSTTYTLTASEINAVITAQVSYMDKTGFNEVITSDPTSAVAAALLSPQPSTLVASATDTTIEAGQTTQLSLNNTAGSGTISYSVTSGSCTVNASGLLTAGTTVEACVVSATIAESTTHSAGTAPDLTVNVVNAQTATLASAPSGGIANGGTYQVSVNNQGGSGALTYSISSGSCSVNNSGLVTSSGTGTCSIQVEVAGSATHNNATLTQDLTMLATLAANNVRVKPRYNDLFGSDPSMPIYTPKTGWSVNNSNGSIQRIYATGLGVSGGAKNRSHVEFVDTSGNALQIEKVEGFGSVENNGMMYRIDWNWNISGKNYHAKLRFRRVDSSGNPLTAWSGGLLVNRVDTLLNLDWNAYKLGRSDSWSGANGNPTMTLPLVSGVSNSDIFIVNGGGYCNVNTSTRVVTNNTGNSDISDMFRRCSIMGYVLGTSSRAPWFTGYYSGQGYYQGFPMPKIGSPSTSGCMLQAGGTACPSGKELATNDQLQHSACSNVTIDPTVYDSFFTQRRRFDLADEITETISIKELIKRQERRVRTNTGSVVQDAYFINNSWSHPVSNPDPEATAPSNHAAVCVDAPATPTQCQMVYSQPNRMCPIGWRMARDTSEMTSVCSSKSIDMTTSSAVDKYVVTSTDIYELSGSSGNRTVQQFVDDGTEVTWDPQWHGHWQAPATWNACVK